MINRLPIELSYTRLKELLCPHRFQQLYLKGVEEPDSEAAHMGTVLHFWAARYGLHLQQMKRYTDKDWFITYTSAQVLKEPEYLQEQMLQTAGMFVDSFQLDKSADEHFFERRLAVSRGDYTPCEPTAPIDRIAGTLDHIAVYSGGTQVSITDYKMGFRQISYDEVQVDPQLKLYAWLWLMSHPQCQVANVTLWGPRWGGKNKSLGSFTRETAREGVESCIEASWSVIEHYLSELGESDWPTKPHWRVCQYCQLACPEYSANLERYMREAA